MPELRKDPVISRWVIIATDRAKRPCDFATQEDKPSDPAQCPFCPGHEEATPSEVYAVRPAASLVNTPGWEIRVTPNKFPALRIEEELNQRQTGVFERMNGVGAHEVIIETPDHFKELHEHPAEYIAKILEVIQLRISALADDGRIRYVMLFKNRGEVAGASLSHPHSQLIATPIVPKRVAEELAGSHQHWEAQGSCIFCDMTEQILQARDLLIDQNEGFVVIAPFASRFPFEVWILPKRHQADYLQVARDERMQLALMLRLILRKWHQALGEVSYNLMLHTTPTPAAVGERFPRADAHYHWHFEMFPRLTRIAGFEWGTGFYINPTSPEEAAQFLRELTPDSR